MALSHADVLVHPLRMRIVTAMGLQKMTAGDIAAHLPDIPQASLYRHLALLVKADVVQIVETRPVRGAVEKVYALDVNAATLSLEEPTAAVAICRSF
jgi:DNA-binding transcriptional ArsR family regulator